MVSEETPYSRLFDGVELPAELGGHPALELCNTRAGWGEDEPKEYLASYRHLVSLARALGLVSAAAAAALPDDAPDVHARALRFRDALYATVRTPTAGAAWDAVAAEVEHAAAAATFTPDGWSFPQTAELPLLVFAHAAGELIASPHPPIRACPGRRCGWLFLDPRGRRRWCTMATCGNREKARRHAARVRTGAGAV
jgi:CGNR zinc finger protein/putative stress-induced transcription regulator